MIVASEIDNLKWMLASPKLSATAIGADGYPVPMVAPDPRAFAVYKLFLSTQDDREPIKKDRDRRQAFAVTELIEKRLHHLSFDDESMRIFPAKIHQIVDELRAPFVSLDDDAQSQYPEAFRP